MFPEKLSSGSSFLFPNQKKKNVLTDQETAVSSNIYGDNWHLVV